MKKEKWQNLLKTGIKFFPLFLLIIISLYTTACGKKENFKKIFTETVEKNNFITTTIEKQTLAISDHYQIVLTEFKDNSDCKKQYNKLLKKYKNITQKDNYFYIKNENVYTVVYMIDNYCIECSAPKVYEKEINKIMRKMNLKI